MTVLSAIGDIERFPTAKKLVGYAGLGARIHASGQTHKSGGITKQGRKELRTVLIEAAWITIRYDRHWQGQFERLAHRIGRHKAIVAIARKLLVVIWIVSLSRPVEIRTNGRHGCGFSLPTYKACGQGGQLCEIAHPVHRLYDGDGSVRLSLHCQDQTLKFEPSP